jgi:hypothetical protein
MTLTLYVVQRIGHVVAAGYFTGLKFDAEKAKTRIKDQQRRINCRQNKIKPADKRIMAHLKNSAG